MHDKHRPKLSKHGTDRFCLSNAHSQCLKSLDYIPKANPGGPFCYLATDSFLRQNTEVQQSKFIVWPVCPSGIFNSPYHRLFFSPLITNSCKKQLLVSYCLLLLLWLPLAVYFCSPASHLPLCRKKKILFEFTVCMGHELIPGTCPPLYPCLFNIFRNNTCD